MGLHPGAGSQPEGELAAKQVGGQVTAAVGAEGTYGDDPGVGHGADGGGYVFAASLAAQGEVTEPGVGNVEHGAIIGEQKAKIMHRGREGWEQRPENRDQGSENRDQRAENRDQDQGGRDRGADIRRAIKIAT
jgi:hypothetical protein